MILKSSKLQFNLIFLNIIIHPKIWGHYTMAQQMLVLWRQLFELLQKRQGDKIYFFLWSFSARGFTIQKRCFPLGNFFPRSFLITMYWVILSWSMLRVLASLRTKLFLRTSGYNLPGKVIRMTSSLVFSMKFTTISDHQSKLLREFSLQNCQVVIY